MTGGRDDRKGGMTGREAGQDGGRTRRRQDKTEAGQKGDMTGRTGRRQDRVGGFRTGGMYVPVVM